MAEPLKSVSRESMRELDRRTIEEWNIPGRLLMENAGRAVVAEALHVLRATKVSRAVAQHMHSSPEGNGSRKTNPKTIDEINAWKSDLQSASGSVCVLCGPGNNGGDGFVIARVLLNLGVEVSTFIVGEQGRAAYTGDAADNLELLAAHGHQVRVVDSATDIAELKEALGKSDLCVDALFGTGLTRSVEGVFADAIDAINQSGLPIVAVDIPSGLDANSGELLGPTTKAEITVTFAVAKHGMLTAQGVAHSGRINVAEIGIPQQLIDQAISDESN